MEQNSKPVDTPPTSKGQNQAHNVESTLSSQTTEKPYVGGYVAQCSICFKWRRLPSKEKYEEIREHGVFVCTDVPKWCPCLPCCNNTDLTDDGNWAIEKQNIQPPPGWERLVKIRDSDGDKYADIYYIPPSGGRLRSTADVRRYFGEHPDEAEGVDLSQFSFQPPTPSSKIYQSYFPGPGN